MSERLCFNCGKPGHSAAQCPDGKDLKLFSPGAPAPTSPGEVPFFYMEREAAESREPWKTSKRPGPKRPRQPVRLLDFITPNAFASLTSAEDPPEDARPPSLEAPEVSEATFPVLKPMPQDRRASPARLRRREKPGHWSGSEDMVKKKMDTK